MRSYLRRSEAPERARNQVGESQEGSFAASYLKLARSVASASAISFCALVAAIAQEAAPASEQASKSHAYIGSSAVITAEVENEHTVIVNIVNLSDTIFVFEAKNLILRSGDDIFSIGQVIDEPETDYRGDTWKYRAASLLRPRSFGSFKVLGAFRATDLIQSVMVRIGGRRYHLVPLSPADFNQLADKIQRIDLKAEDGARALQEAGLEPLGELSFPQGPEDNIAESKGLITPDGVNPPKVIRRTRPQYTPEALRARVQGVVKISAVITKNGGLVNPKVVRGLGHGLDQRAIETIVNSWVFLPATKDGEVVETTATIDVEFKLEP